MGTAYAISPNGQYVAGWDDQAPFGANGWVVYFDDLLFTTPTGIRTDTNPEPVIAVFPNPAHEFLKITSAEAIDMVTLYNAQGQMVAQHAIRSRAGVIDITALSSGVYTVRTTGRDGSHALSVVKQ